VRISRIHDFREIFRYRAGDLERHRQLLAQWNKTTDEGASPVLPNPVAGQKRTKR